MTTLTVDPRFCGPPGTANGGYAAGLMAQRAAVKVRIRLERPIPVQVPLELEPRKPMRLPAFVPKPISLSPYPGGVQAVEKAALDGPDGCLLARHAPILPYCSPQAKW